METKETTKKDQSSNKRKTPIAIGKITLVLVVLTGLILGYFWLTDALTYTSTEDAVIDGEHASVSARILGRINTIFLHEGDKVEAGQLLVLLDDTDLRAQAKQATAALNTARKNLLLSQVSLERTKSDFNRLKILLETGSTTKEQYDHALNAMETAAAQHAVAQSQVDTATAQVEILNVQLQHTQVTSPISGVIAKQSFFAGEVVQPGQTIFTINNLQSIWVTANFEETKIGRIKTDAAVIISVDAYPHIKLKGRVKRIGAGILPPPFSIGEFTKTTQRVPVRIDLVNLPQALVLLPGMSAEVKVKIKQ